MPAGIESPGTLPWQGSWDTPQRNWKPWIAQVGVIPSIRPFERLSFTPNG